MQFILGVIAILLAFSVYAFFIEPSRLKQRHYLIRKNKQRVLDISDAYDMFTQEGDVTIAHISDLHFSRWSKPRRLNKIIRSIMEMQPDIIVFTGDLIDDYKHWPKKQTDRLIEKLKRLKAPMGKIAVLGNHDYKHGGQYFVKEVLKEAGFTTLVNEEVFGSDAKISMNIVGIDDLSGGSPSYNFESTLAEWHILLAHQPDQIEAIHSLDQYDLVLSGHSHGGQIRLPYLYIKTQGAKRYTDSLYLPTKNTILSVNTGVGMTMIPARFGVPPEIIYYHLSNKRQIFENFDGNFNFEKQITVEKNEGTPEETRNEYIAPDRKAVPQTPTDIPTNPNANPEDKPEDKTDKIVDINLFRRRYKNKKII
ncbi:metallophosphoesterase [Enterococcus saigonensis]|uniref:Metallophosphoesterase n=1 Tax=Enterococcus saigonensis TaxID=1805431 RepID=A0A679IMI6_9ENTE|nr:metallophosphoesterase [Enterococcus saigonensis]BCA84984.1 metallophosphoesterase [Enterococcus saigonensis]